MAFGNDKFFGKNIPKVLILAIAFIVVVGLFFITSQETNVEVSAEQVRIKGLYGGTYSMNEITDIQLVNSIPKITRRTNGAAFGNYKKGHFKLEQLGDCKLFVHSSEGPYIIIKNDDRDVIINFKDKNNTQKLYNELLDNWKGQGE